MPRLGLNLNCLDWVQATLKIIKRTANQPLTLNSQHSTLNPHPSTLNSQPSAFNPQPSDLNPQPSTLVHQVPFRRGELQEAARNKDAGEPRKTLGGGIQKSIFKRPCHFLAINAHKMAPRTHQQHLGCPHEGPSVERPLLIRTGPPCVRHHGGFG
jgi:hypothetical protein